MRRCGAGELVTNQSEDEVLPDVVCNALAEAQNPLSTREVKRVLPYWAADALMKEEVVCRREESRWRMEVRPEGPEGLYRGKGGNLLGLGDPAAAAATTSACLRLRIARDESQMG